MLAGSAPEASTAPNSFGPSPRKTSAPPSPRRLASRALGRICPADRNHPPSVAGAGLGLLGKRSWQSEVGEEAALGEPCDVGDALVSERQDHQSVGAGDRRLRIGEVAPEGGLGVGARGHEPEVRAATSRAVIEELGDRLSTLVL